MEFSLDQTKLAKKKRICSKLRLMMLEMLLNTQSQFQKNMPTSISNKQKIKLEFFSKYFEFKSQTIPFEILIKENQRFDRLFREEKFSILLENDRETFVKIV